MKLSLLCGNRWRLIERAISVCVPQQIAQNCFLFHQLSISQLFSKNDKEGGGVTHVSFLSYQGILEKNDRICLDFKWRCRRIFETFSLDRDRGTQSHYLSALPLESLSAQKKDTCLRDSPVFHVSKNTRLKKHFYPEHIFLKATNFLWVICSLHCTQTFVLKPPPPFSLTGLHN